MARQIILRFNNKNSKFDFKKITRSSLYGSKKRIALDESNKSCILANIETRYGTIINSGDASNVHVDNKNNYINKSEIIGIDSEGNKIDRFPSTINIPQVVNKTNENYLLDFDCSSLYNLKPDILESDFQEKLDNGDIFSFNFNYYEDFNVEKGVIIKNDNGYFAIIGKEIFHSWIEKSENISEGFETPDDIDIDFEML